MNVVIHQDTSTTIGAGITPASREDLIEAIAEIHRDEEEARKATFVSRAVKRVAHETRVAYLRATFPIRRRIAASRHGK